MGHTNAHTITRALTYTQQIEAIILLIHTVINAEFVLATESCKKLAKVKRLLTI